MERNDYVTEPLFSACVNIVTVTTQLINSESRPDALLLVEAGSQHNYAGSWHEQPIKLAYSYTRALMLSAGDHLLALAEVIQPPTPSIFALDSLARGCAEAAARCVWMADPRIGLRQRVARLMTELLYSNYEQERLLQPLGGPEEVTINSDLILADAANLGFDIVDGRAPAVQSRRVSSTKIVGDAVGIDRGRFIYQVLSAGTHSTIFALLGRMATLQMRQSAGAAEEREAATATLQSMIALAVQSSCEVYIAAGEAMATWGGLESANWTAECEAAMSTIQRVVAEWQPKRPAS